MERPPSEVRILYPMSLWGALFRLPLQTSLEHALVPPAMEPFTVKDRSEKIEPLLADKLETAKTGGGF